MKHVIFSLIFILITNLISAETLEDIQWITEEYPPYNFVENGQPKGIAVDLLIEIWKKVGLKKTRQDIKVYPWARGVKMIKNLSNTCLFSASITAERKNILGWKFVYPIPQASTKSDNHIITIKNSGIKFNSIEDLKNYSGRFGVVRGDVGAALLLENGVNEIKLDEASTPESLIRKLQKKRYRAISYGRATTFDKMKELGIDPNGYEVAFAFPLKPTGYAFHHSIDPQILKNLQKALNELHKNGTAAKIQQKYVKQ